MNNTCTKYKRVDRLSIRILQPFSDWFPQLICPRLEHVLPVDETAGYFAFHRSTAIRIKEEVYIAREFLWINATVQFFSINTGNTLSNKFSASKSKTINLIRHLLVVFHSNFAV